jgi:hypothetical protein
MVYSDGIALYLLHDEGEFFYFVSNKLGERLTLTGVFIIQSSIEISFSWIGTDSTNASKSVYFNSSFI